MSADPLFLAKILQKASRLTESKYGQEAWYMVSLTKQTLPCQFLRICHDLLATEIELTNDHFEVGWPLKTRLLVSESYQPSRIRRLFLEGNSSTESRSSTPSQLKSLLSQNDSFTLLRSPLARLNGEDPVIVGRPGSMTAVHRTRTARLCNKVTNRFRQVLPSCPLPVSPVTVSTIPDGVKPILSHSRSPITKRSNSFVTSQPECCGSDENCGRGYDCRLEGMNIKIMRYLIDYMTHTPGFTSTERIFRLSGVASRMKNLSDQLTTCIQTSYCKTVRPVPDESMSVNVSSVFTPPPFECRSQSRRDVYRLLSISLPHDIANILLRYLADSAHHGSGLIPPQITELLIYATRLQYPFTDNQSAYMHADNGDWVHKLCHSRQILVYRIVIQFLLPAPERHILLKLLNFLSKITTNAENSKMSAEALGRCISVSVFGDTEKLVDVLSHLNEPVQPTRVMGWCIDTLVNLIEVFEELEEMPALLYHKVQSYIQSKVGHSPQPRSEQADRMGCHTVMKRSWKTCQIRVNFETNNTPTRMKRHKTPLKSSKAPEAKENQIPTSRDCTGLTEADEQGDSKVPSVVSKGESKIEISHEEAFVSKLPGLFEDWRRLRHACKRMSKPHSPAPDRVSKSKSHLGIRICGSSSSN